MGKIIGFGLGGISVIAVLTVVFGSWYVVDEGERGVILRNGAIVSTADPALHFKLPIIENVVYVDVREQYRAYPMQAYSRDQQVADVSVSVSYRVPVDRVQDVYSEYGSVEALIDRLVTRKVNEVVKTVFGTFTAASSIQERGRLNATILNELIESMDNGPIIITGVQVEDVSFSAAYEASVEERMQAEVAVQRREQELRQEEILADIAVTQAQGRADSVIAEAQARAEATRIQGQAEADAIEARGDALRNNPNLIELVKAENWDGVLPTTVLPNGALPFVDATPTPTTHP